MCAFYAKISNALAHTETRIMHVHSHSHTTTQVFIGTEAVGLRDRYDDVDEKWYESSDFRPSTKKLLSDKPDLVFINRQVAPAHTHHRNALTHTRTHTHTHTHTHTSWRMQCGRGGS